MERVIEQELETLKTIANELEKDFKNLLDTNEPEIQYMKARIKKQLNTLQTIVIDLKTDLDWIVEWRKEK